MKLKGEQSNGIGVSRSFGDFKYKKEVQSQSAKGIDGWFKESIFNFQKVANAVKINRWLVSRVLPM